MGEPLHDVKTGLGGRGRFARQVVVVEVVGFVLLLFLLLVDDVTDLPRRLHPQWNWEKVETSAAFLLARVVLLTTRRLVKRLVYLEDLAARASGGGANEKGAADPASPSRVTENGRERPGSPPR
jgi:hypothetical protein